MSKDLILFDGDAAVVFRNPEAGAKEMVVNIEMGRPVKLDGTVEPTHAEVSAFEYLGKLEPKPWLPEDTVHTLKMCEARATRMMNGEQASIAPIVSIMREILSKLKESEK